MKELIDIHDSLNPLPMELISPELARQQPLLNDVVLSFLSQHATKRVFGSSILHPVQSVSQISIPADDSEILLKIYTPSGDGPFPLLVYFHGGGFVVGNLNSYDSSCRLLCDAVNCVVVSVGYRQAPEHPYPAAVHDAFDAYKWILNNGLSLGSDVIRIAVAGEGSGGNLAACVCLRAKAEGLKMPVHQLLLYPITQFEMETSSYFEHQRAKPLNTPMLKWFKKHYMARERSLSYVDASPLNSHDFRDLPPATILNAEIDPLRDDGFMYAKRLYTSQVPVYHKVYPGLGHDFFGLAPLVDTANLALRDAARSLNHAFEREMPPSYEDFSGPTNNFYLRTQKKISWPGKRT